jgi:hypothetical protein
MSNDSRMLECSTAHMTERDSQLLDLNRKTGFDNATLPVMVGYFGAGYFVRVWAFGEPEFDPRAALKAHGFSDAFITFLGWARQQGYLTVLFDRDAEPATGLPQFDW